MSLGAALGLALNWAGNQGMVDADIVGTVAIVGKEVGDLFLRLLQMLVVPLKEAGRERGGRGHHRDLHGPGRG